MENNPVKYEDLIQSDDSFRELIALLKEANGVYGGFVERVRSDAKQYVKAIREASGATEDQRDALSEVSEKVEHQRKVYKTLNGFIDENTKMLAAAKEAKRQEAAAVKLVAKEYLAAEGSLEKMRATQARLKAEQKALNLTTEEGRKESQRYNEQILELKNRINEVEQAQGNFTGSVGNYEKATFSARRELRDMNDALAEAALNGDLASESSQQLIQQAVRLQDAFKDTQMLIKNMASDTLALDTVLGGMATAGGGFSAVTGAMRLFGGESENVAKAQKQLQAAIAITTGLTAIQNNLQRQSALMGAVATFQAHAQAKANAIKAAAIGKSNAALAVATVRQGAFNLVAKANPYVLLATALLTVVGALVLFSRRNRDAAIDQARLNRETAQATQIIEESARSAANQLSVFTRLQTQWRNLTDDYATRVRFVEQNRREFESLGVSVQNVNDAENLLIRNSQAFVNSVMARARALAAQNIATQEFERALIAQLEQREAAEREANLRAQGALEERSVQFSRQRRLESGLTARQQLNLNTELLNTQKKYEKLGYTASEAFARAKAFIEMAVEAEGQRQKYAENANIQLLDTMRVYEIKEELERDMLKLERELAQERIRAIEDETERRIAEVRHQSRVRIEDIKLRTKEEGEITKMELETIALIEQNGANRILQIREEANERILRAEMDAQLQSLETTQKGINLRLAVVTQGTEDEINLRMDALENQRQIEILRNRRLAEEFRQDEREINKKYDLIIANEREEMLFNQMLNELRIRQDFYQSESDLMRKTDAERFRFRKALEAERLQALLDMNENALNQMSEMEVQTIKNTIEAINREIARNQRTEIFDGLRVGINEISRLAIDSLRQITDARIRAANEAVIASRRTMDAAQRELDHQRNMAEQGFASSRIRAQKELDLARQTYEQAQREKEKAAQQQQRIDAVMQKSSLITAASNLWKSLSGIPVIGKGLAIAAVAAMFGSFAAARARANQIARSESYGDGHVELLRGGSHASGNDIDLGVKKDGTRRRAEGGEYFAVINKRNSAKYGGIIPDVINAFNEGTFAEKYLQATKKLSINVNSGNKTNLGNLLDDVSAMRRQGERRYENVGGKTIVRYKNLTRVING